MSTLISSVYSAINPDESLRLSPERGNVAFASAQMGWVFTLRSFAQMYSDTYGKSIARLTIFLAKIMLKCVSSGAVDIDELAPRLWGNIYFNEETRKFSKKPADPETKRSFVHFILEPLYKLYTQVRVLLCTVVGSLLICDDCHLGHERGNRNLETDASKAKYHVKTRLLQDGCSTLAQSRAGSFLRSSTRIG
jgi:hypothetical protein